MESPPTMPAHLILAASFGLIAAVVGAVTGSGLGSVMLWYLGGCWGGFLLSVLLVLALRARAPVPAAARSHHAPS
jgi:hypothetical protein